ARVEGAFLFASEIKCLLEHPHVPRTVNEEALYHFLTFLTTPAPSTLFKDIYKLQPGHRMFVAGDGQVQVEEYWDVFDSVRYDPGLTEADLVERLRAGLRESVGLRMVSDVPFGVLLSGGIDSTTNVALMAEQMDRPVQTFSIGYEGAVAGEYNEFQYARQAARHFRTDHHEVLIGPQDLLDFLPKLIYHQDEPIADPVCVPVYFVSKLAKDAGTTVVQVGEGADELFSGYAHWLRALRLHAGPWRAFTALPRPVRQLSLAAAAPVLRGLRMEYLRRGVAGEELFWGGAIAFGEIAKRALLAPDYRRRMAGLSSHDVIRPHRERFDARSPLSDYLTWMGYLDLRMRLPELLLMRVDKMAMATSVEARVPFLDHEFVGLAMSIPQRQKLNGYQPKHLLKQAVRGLIPDEIIDRPKQGFRVPVRQWLDDALGPVMESRLRDFCRRTDYFDWRAVQSLLQSRDELSWYLLNFAMWHELWIEGSAK
ncbi:MAG: asparagine synthase (glutamine-hydrolyzing), partial [Anaerolineales bacterium]